MALESFKRDMILFFHIECFCFWNSLKKWMGYDPWPLNFMEVRNKFQFQNLGVSYITYSHISKPQNANGVSPLFFQPKYGKNYSPQESWSDLTWLKTLTNSPWKSVKVHHLGGGGSPTNPWVFLLKMIILGCEMGVSHHLRKHPFKKWWVTLFGWWQVHPY